MESDAQKRANLLRKRVDEITRWLNDSTDDGMREKYGRATELTNAAADSLVRLTDAGVSESEAYSVFADEMVRSMKERAQALDQRVDALVPRIEHPANDRERERARLERANINIAILTEGTRRLTFEMMEVHHSREAAAIPGLSGALFGKILSRTEKSFRKEAAFRAIEVAIGLTPVVGTVYDLGKKARELYNLGGANALVTERHNAYINDYCDALDRWLAAAEATTNRLDAASASWSDAGP